MKNYLVVHGSFGSPFGNWFSWFYKMVSQNDNQVLVPQFPVGVDYQNYNNWSSLLDNYRDLGLINEGTVFIGHSIGAIFIVRYIIERNINAAKLILTAGFNNYVGVGGDYDKVNESFFIADISPIRGLVKEIICIRSNNDPYVSQEALTNFAQEIATKEVVIENGGHLNSESGYESFEKILKYI